MLAYWFLNRLSLPSGEKTLVGGNALFTEDIPRFELYDEHRCNSVYLMKALYFVWVLLLSFVSHIKMSDVALQKGYSK